MSGEKCAYAELTDAAEAEFQSHVDQARRAAELVARLANLAGRLDRMNNEIDSVRRSPHASETVRAALEEFATLSQQLRERSAAIKALLRQVPSLVGAARATALEEARRVRAQIDGASRELDTLASTLESRMPGVINALEAERRSGRYRAAAQTQAVHADLAGLREEVMARLDPGTFGSLQPVEREAKALLARVDGLLRAADPSAQVVDACRRDLAQLVETAAARARDQEKQWEMFERIDRVCEETGFNRVRDVNLPAAGEALESAYAKRADGHESSMEWRIYRGGRVRVSMYGRAEGAIEIDHDGPCVDHIRDIAALARANGINISRFMQEDPDNPDGWTALSLDKEDEQPRQHKKEKGQTKAKLR